MNGAGHLTLILLSASVRDSFSAMEKYVPLNSNLQRLLRSGRRGRRRKPARPERIYLLGVSQKARPIVARITGYQKKGIQQRLLGVIQQWLHG